MFFKIILETSRGNLLLSGDSKKPLERVPLFLKGEKVAEIFETIGRVEEPFYLAKPLRKDLKGKVLSSSRS
ncbi:MAG: hypothetical protein M1594_01725 [Candidatus Marsarchaeota archaeon]|nr:hypothetical protein [Candidatus Marsarchaeota archaeon]